MARNHRTCIGHPNKEIPGYRATVTSKSGIIAVRDTREVICANTCGHHSRLWYLDIAELITLGRRQTRPATQPKPCILGGRSSVASSDDTAVGESKSRKDRASRSQRNPVAPQLP